MPQPTTSPAWNVGPYARPVFWLEKQRPSSPWYPQDSGSHPTGLPKGTAFVEKPMAMVVLRSVQSAPPPLSATHGDALVSLSLQYVHLEVV